jgi:hypothetical protein
MVDMEKELLNEVLEQLRNVGLNNVASDIYNAAANLDMANDFADLMSKNDMNAVVENMYSEYLNSIKELIDRINLSGISTNYNEEDKKHFSYLHSKNSQTRHHIEFVNRLDDLRKDGRVYSAYKNTIFPLIVSAVTLNDQCKTSKNVFYSILDRAKNTFSLGKNFFVSKWKKEYYPQCMDLHDKVINECKRWVGFYNNAEKVICDVEVKMNHIYDRADYMIGNRKNVIESIDDVNVQVKPKKFKLFKTFQKNFKKCEPFIKKFKVFFEKKQDVPDRADCEYSISLKDMRLGEIFNIYKKLDENKIEYDAVSLDGDGKLVFMDKDNAKKAICIINDVRKIINDVPVESQLDIIYTGKKENVDDDNEKLDDVNKTQVDEQILDNSNLLGEEVESIIDKEKYIQIDAGNSESAKLICETADKHEMNYQKVGNVIYFENTSQNFHDINVICMEAKMNVAKEKVGNYSDNLPGVTVYGDGTDEVFKEELLKLLDESGQQIGVKLVDKLEDHTVDTERFRSVSIISLDKDTCISINEDKTYAFGCEVENNSIMTVSFVGKDSVINTINYEYTRNYDTEKFRIYDNEGNLLVDSFYNENNQIVSREINDGCIVESKDLQVKSIKEFYDAKVNEKLPKYSSINDYLEKSDIDMLNKHYDCMIRYFNKPATFKEKKLEPLLAETSMLHTFTDARHLDATAKLLDKLDVSYKVEGYDLKIFSKNNGFVKFDKAYRLAYDMVNLNLSDITISKSSLIIQEDDKAVKTRVPGTYGDNVRYFWIDKNNIIDIYNGKTILSFIDQSKSYELFDKDNNAVEISGKELYSYYDRVDIFLRDKVENGFDKTKDNSFRYKQNKEFSEKVIAAFEYEHNDGDQCWSDDTIFYKKSNGKFIECYRDGYTGESSSYEVSYSDIKNRMLDVQEKAKRRIGRGGYKIKVDLDTSLQDIENNIDDTFRYFRKSR